MSLNTFFQYCQKLVILSEDKTKVLLAKRRNESHFNETYAFIGGKMETTDKSILLGMKREKDEEVSPQVKIKVLAEESYNVLFRKKDGTAMIVPHIAGIYISGDIVVNNEEYTEYKWIDIDKLKNFEPKVENIFEMTIWAKNKLDSARKNQLTEI